MSLENVQYRVYHNPIPIDGTPVPFNNGLALSAGTYRLRYDGGALQYSDITDYQVNYQRISTPTEDPYNPVIIEHFGYQLKLNEIDYNLVNCPGGYTEYNSISECEISVLNTYDANDEGVNELSDYIDFIHPGGKIEIFLNTPIQTLSSSSSIPEEELPIFSLTKVFDNKLSSSPVAYDYSANGTQYSFNGSNRNLFFHLHRSNGSITTNVNITVPINSRSKNFKLYFEELVVDDITVLPGNSYNSPVSGLNGAGTHDYIRVFVSDISDPIGSDTYSNDYSIGFTSPQITSPKKSITPTPANETENLAPIKISCIWQNQVDLSALEPILGWDVWLENSYIDDVNSLNYEFANLEKNTEYSWKVVPYTSSQNHPNYEIPAADIWTFTTSSIDTDGFVRDQRMIDLVSDQSKMIVRIKWSLYNMWHSDPVPVIDSSLFANIHKFGVFYRYQLRTNTGYNWIQIHEEPHYTNTQIYDVDIDMSTKISRSELSKIFTHQSDNILEFKVIAYSEGTLRNESCGVMFPHSFNDTVINPNDVHYTSCDKITHISAKTQIYINVDGDVIGFDNVKYKVLSEFEKVWDSQSPKPEINSNIQDSKYELSPDTKYSNYPSTGLGLVNPSRITVDKNLEQTGRNPSVWAAYRGLSSIDKSNGLVKYDFYTGEILHFWQENNDTKTTIPGDATLREYHRSAHGSGTRGVTIDSGTGNVISGGHTTQIHPNNGLTIPTNVPGITDNYGSVIDHHGTTWVVASWRTHIMSYSQTNGSRIFRIREQDTPVIPPDLVDESPYLFSNSSNAALVYTINADSSGGIWLGVWNGGPDYEEENSKFAKSSPTYMLIRFVPTSTGEISHLQLINLTPDGTTENDKISGICADMIDYSNNKFNIWACAPYVQRVLKCNFVKNNDDTVSWNYTASFSTNEDWRPHGIALDSDNNIWVAPLRNTGCYKIYQKGNHSDWGSTIFTQGGLCTYPPDIDHPVYNQWDVGDYPGTGIYEGKSYRYIAHDLLKGTRVYPNYEGNQLGGPVLVNSGNTGNQIVFFNSNTLSPFIYMYSDFTGQVMKSTLIQNPVIELELPYEAVWSIVS